MMKLWLLRPHEDLPDDNNPWEPWYDKCFGMVVRAATENEARAMAQGVDESGDYEEDMRGAWLDSTLSTCTELTAEGEPGVVIRDEHWA
ncbi:MAG: hypothetical protein ACYTEQ_22770 [Planctomycetota bacterium]|jgi:hypothetical protein